MTLLFKGSHSYRCVVDCNFKKNIKKIYSPFYFIKVNQYLMNKNCVFIN